MKLKINHYIDVKIKNVESGLEEKILVNIDNLDYKEKQEKLKTEIIKTINKNGWEDTDCEIYIELIELV